MRLLIFLVLLFYGGANACQLEKSDLTGLHAIAWGPGLSPQVNMPLRYFFLQLVNAQGRNITKLPEKFALHVTASGHIPHKAVYCNVWSDIYDVMYGLFIIRYEMYDNCPYLDIEVFSKNAQMPLYHKLIQGPILENECSCPYSTFHHWRRHYQCPEEDSQMVWDVNRYNKVDFDAIRTNIINKYAKKSGNCVTHYAIKSNLLYRHYYGEDNRRSWTMDLLLLTLLRKIKLPDMEFFVNVGDNPIVPFDDIVNPIFSGYTSNETNDILIPSYDLTNSALRGMDEIKPSIFLSLLHTGLSWDQKVEKLFWVGYDSNENIDALYRVMNIIPSYFNISYFYDTLSEAEEGLLIPKNDVIPDFTEFKYNLYVEGLHRLRLYQLPYLLASETLIFKAESKYYEYYSKNLLPGIHYVPVKHDFSDLIDKIIWAKKHKRAARRIIKSGKKFVLDNLLPHNILCYYTTLLYEWSLRVKSNIIPEDYKMVLVDTYSEKCKCYHNNPSHKF